MADENDASSARKRKIDSLLGVLDESMFVPQSPAKQSTFAPWDRGALLDRLLTFRSYQIHSRDSPISAIQIARRGWKYTEKSTIECTHCHERLVISLDSEVSGVYEELEKRYGEAIATGHRKTCPWKQKGCELKLLRIPLADPQMSLEAYQRRLGTFVNSVLILLKETQGEDNMSDMTEAQKCAILGWSLEASGSLKLLSCQDCHRRVRPTEGEQIDVYGEHYQYCPWIWSVPQGSEAGYKLLLQHYHKSKSKSRSEVNLEETNDCRSQEILLSTEDENPREKVRSIKRKLGFV